jgi:hypothetical protein
MCQNLLHYIKKYMHIKACVAMGNAPIAWGQDKTFIVYLGGGTILWLKGINPLVFCSKCRKQCKSGDQEFQG